jgi:hypothetical protein
MDIGQLHEEIARLKALTAEKEALVFRAEQNTIAAENESVASIIRATNHSLICPFCGVTVKHTRSLDFAHMGCYSTGYWARGFRTHNDWLRACIINGAGVAEFYAKDKKNLNSKQEHGETPNKT